MTLHAGWAGAESAAAEDAEARISIDVKDADVVDVMRLLAEGAASSSWSIPASRAR